MHGTGIRPNVAAEMEIKFLRREGAGVSYHYYLTKEGVTHELVDPDFRAWHAGSSAWGPDSDLNDLSVGIGMESTNSFAEVYPPEQWDAARALVTLLMRRYGIPTTGVLSHKEVSDPPGRKIDPVNFPMDMFRLSLAGPQRMPLYDERNALLGTVTVVEDRKVYLPDLVLATLCDDGS